MSTTSLCVVLDDAGRALTSAVGQYSLELTRGLIEAAPRGCDVRAFVPSSPDSEYSRIEKALPGLTSLDKSALDRRQLESAWQHGFIRIQRGGMVHSPSMLAPLYRHDPLNNPGEQTVVTAHDAICFTHPELLPARQMARHRTMLRRAERYADALIVPTHAVAEQISERHDFGQRIRVIPGAPSRDLALPPDAAARRERLGVPDRFALSVGALTAASGVLDLVAAVGDDAMPDDLPVIVVGEGPLDVAAAMSSAGVTQEQLRVVDPLDRADLAALYHHATVLIAPGIADGFGQSALEAMNANTPVVHSDAAGLAEVCADAGLVVERGDVETFARRLAEAVSRVVDDDSLADELRARGRDRCHAFTWHDAAERVWQVHADL